MENKLQVRKIYVDSRFKTAGSASHSDFQYNLPESLSLPDSTIAYIDNIVIPNSWQTIDSYNNKLYCRVTDYTSGAIDTDKIITLTENNYNTTTLKTELLTKINSAFGNVISTLDFDQVLLRYNITLNANRALKIFTNKELTDANTFSVAYDKSNLNSANELLTIIEPQKSQYFKTGIVNLMRYRNLYLTCPSLSNYNTLSPNGSSNVVKKIPVTAGYGDIIYCNLLAIHDYIDVSRLLIKTLEFQICDSYGKVIDLRGMPVSFSLIFMPNNME